MPSGPPFLRMRPFAPFLDPERRLVHADASAETVAMLRIGVFALCAAEASVLLMHPIELPAGAYSAFGFQTLLPAPWLRWMQSIGGQQVTGWVALVTALAAAIGFFPKFLMPVATVGLVVTQMLPRSVQGFVNHAQVPIMLCALLLSVGPASDSLTIWPRPRIIPGRRDYQSTVVLMLAMICVGYLFISAHRIAYGGWELFSSDSLAQWIVRRNLGAPSAETEFGMMLVRNPTLALIAKIAFPFITLLEFSAPLCLLSRRYRVFFVPVMLSVHLMIYLTMHISFSQLALLYVVFIDSRHWSPRRLDAPATGTVFFDGVCGLCNRFVDFLIAHDRARRLRFAPLTGASAARLHLTVANADTVMYAEGRDVLDRSSAAIAAVSRLGGGWSFAAVLGLVPRPVRDLIYDWVARHRYDWFGRRDSCRLPSASEAAVFLD